MLADFSQWIVETDDLTEWQRSGQLDAINLAAGAVDRLALLILVARNQRLFRAGIAGEHGPATRRIIQRGYQIRID